MSVYADFLEKHYKRGEAVGQSYIRDDRVVLRFRNETFTFNSGEVAHLLKTDGTFYIAKVKDLRKLKKAH